ncbi:unnamed protein product [Closterium sp. NIES-54]
MGWTDAVSDRMSRLLATASRRGKCESPPEEVQRGGFPAKARQSEPVMYDESVDNASSFAATSFSTTTTSTTTKRGAASSSAVKTGTSAKPSTTVNTTSTTNTNTTTSTSTINTSAIDSTASRSGALYDSDAGVSASTRADLEPDDIPRGALGAIGAEPGSGSGTGVPAGLGEGSGLGTPGRRTPVKAAAGEGLAGSYGDDSAQIAAATAAAVAAAAESGLGRVGKRPPRVPSTLGVDEEFEGPDTSSLAAFLLSLISINPRGNKASSDTCSESGGSYVDSDFEEEEYEEVGEEDGGVVDGEGKGGVVPSGLGSGQDGRVRRRGRGGMGGEFGGEEGGEGQEEGLRKWDAGESGRVRGGGAGGGGNGGGSGGGAKRGWLPPFISRFAAGPRGARSRESSPSVTPSSSSSSLSADAGCGDVALTSASRLEARENNNGANQGGVATSASAAVSSASSVTLVSAAGAVSGAVSVSRASLAGADEQLQQRMSEPVTTASCSQALTSRASEPARETTGREGICSPTNTATGRGGIVSPNAGGGRGGILSPNSLEASPLMSPRLPDMMEESFLLSDTCRSVICQSLPAIASGREWVLLYSTFKHGISLSTLYRRSSMMPGPCLLVVTEDNGTVFGGFSSQALVASNRRKYQGSSDVFVFTTITGEPTVYKVTGANRYFILCLNEALSFGGGGHFALCLQEDLLTGSSGACETFCSPCLSKSEDFKIKHVELWGFAHQSRYAPTKANWHEPSQPHGFHANCQIGLAAAVSGGGGRRSFGRGCGSRAHAATRGSSGEHLLFRKCVQLNQERAAMAAAFAAEESLEQEVSTYSADGNPNSFIIKSLHDIGVGLSPTAESELEGVDSEDSETEPDKAEGNRQREKVQNLENGHDINVPAAPRLCNIAPEPSVLEIRGVGTPSSRTADLASLGGIFSQSNGSVSLPTTPQVWTPLYQNGSGRSFTGSPGVSGPTTSELLAATSSLRARRAALLALPSLQIPSFLASPGPIESFSAVHGFSGSMLPGSSIPPVQAPLGQLSSFNSQTYQPRSAPLLPSVDSDPTYLAASTFDRTPGWQKPWLGEGLASEIPSSSLAVPVGSATPRQEVVPAGRLHDFLKVENWGALRAVPASAFSGFMSGPSSPAPPTATLLARSLSSAALLDSVASPSFTATAAAEAAVAAAADAAASAASPTNPLYKTELCRSWEETGACRYGGKCQFAHGREELRAVARHPKYKTEVCRTFNLNGTCPYGTRCRFIHYTSASTSAASSPAVGPSPSQLNTTSSLIPGPVGLVPSPLKSQLSLPAARSTVSSVGSAFSTPLGSPRRLPVFETICRESGLEPSTQRNSNSCYGG